ncbi:KGK domain-containing protein [Richelia sinica]|nr:KGK domain-containing protein [Richelia sinica]MBD2666797.1 KGK domain-containing protein [Richelia sinica FACHB-800]
MSEPVGLSQFDVVSINKTKSPLNAATFKVIEFAISLAGRLSKELSGETWKEWYKDGVECEVLRMDGTGWQSGRVRISLEFIPADEEEDEEEMEAQLEDVTSPQLPESPLDDLRSELNIQ